MTIKTCKTAVRASTLLAAIALSGGAFATEGISESFEGESYDAKLTGNGTIATATVTEPTVGYPISGSHTKALEIAGTVTYAEGSAPAVTGASQVDFMFKVEPTDELEDPTGDDIRVALAVGTNDVGTTTAPIKLWCKTASDGAAAWVDLAPAVTTGSWVRATLVLDYSANKCSVSLNGDPALNGSDKWFYFANNGGSYVASITMVGSTMVDDFLVTHSALNSYEIPGGDTKVAASGQGSNVTYEYINKYGVTVEQATDSTYTCADSGMTVAQKFEAGLDPTTDTKFELQTMNVASATEATVTFPGNKGASAYEVEITDKNGDAVSGASASISSVTTGEGVNTATLTLPADADLLYINVKTK